MSCFLGLDLGTSALKAVIVDEAGSVLATSAQALTTSRLRPGWSEQDPAAWVAATMTVLDRLKVEQPTLMQRIRAIGLSGQMHAALLLDEAGRSVRPAILWNDGRSRNEAAELADLGEPMAAELGVQAMPGFTAPKLLWLRQHEPRTLDAARHLLLPKDLIRLELTGEIATDASDAAGTWLMDQAKRDWHAKAVTAARIDPAILPPILEAPAPAGRLRPALAARFGMRADVVVAAGGGDTAVGGVGIGAAHDGDAFVSLGTSGQFFQAANRHRPAPASHVHAFAHALPATWYQMGAMLNGASVLGYVAELVGQSDIPALLGEAEAGFKGPSRLIFLPYLAGERTPLNDPDARGVIFGLTGDSARGEIVQAALEGVAFTIADCLAAVTSVAPRPAAAGFIGGGARSLFWARILATVLDMPIRLLESAEAGPAYGAARLARLAAGDDPQTVLQRPPQRCEILPEKDLVGAYGERFGQFRQLYGALKPEFARLARSLG